MMHTSLNLKILKMKIFKKILLHFISWIISALILFPCLLIDTLAGFKIDSHHEFHKFWYDLVLDNKDSRNVKYICEKYSLIENTININEIIIVELTDYGKDLLLRDITETLELQQYIDYALKSYKKEDDYYEFQLWDFMNIFGKHMFNGCKQIIVNNTIKFKV
jgi:hypothetical protein